MTRDILVTWFVKNYPEYYKAMNLTYHEVSSDHMSPYHGEGSVWAHTMMVMTAASINNFGIEVLTAALLHDIGKPAAKEYIAQTPDKPARNRFSGHEGISTFKAIGVLQELLRDFPEHYTADSIETIIRLISLHGVSLTELKDPLLPLRSKLMHCDRTGAIRVLSDGQEDHYPPRKFLKPSKKVEGKELIMMVGLPCSGKSTYVEENLTGYTIVSRESFLFKLYREHFNSDGALTSYNDIYNFLHSSEYRRNVVNQEFDKYVQQVVKASDKVVIDMTMTSLESRHKVLAAFSKHSAKAVVLMPSMQEIYGRNADREGKYIPEEVFTNMSKAFVCPVLDEGFTDIHLIIKDI